MKRNAAISAAHTTRRNMERLDRTIRPPHFRRKRHNLKAIRTISLINMIAFFLSNKGTLPVNSAAKLGLFVAGPLKFERAVIVGPNSPLSGLADKMENHGRQTSNKDDSSHDHYSDLLCVNKQKRASQAHFGLLTLTQ